MRIAELVCLVGVLANGEHAARASDLATTGDVRASHAGAAAPETARPAPGTGSVSGSAPEAATDPGPAVAIGTNLPLQWADSIAVSTYIGLLEHHAISASFATYEDSGGVRAAASALVGREDVDHLGRITDLGIAWVFYPQQRWNGVLLELGALRRARDVGAIDADRQRDTRSTVYAGRAMFGYSTTFFHVFFASAAAGVSIGYESGTEHSVATISGATSTAQLAHRNVAGEAYLRLGIVFGL